MEIIQQLQECYQHYRQSVETLHEPDEWTAELARAVLGQRDRLQVLLEQYDKAVTSETLPSSFWLEFAQTDACLSRLNNQFRKLEPLITWRQSRQPPEHYWWWFPEAVAKSNSLKTVLWGGLTIAALTASLALAQDIATRFLTGAPGVWSSIGAIAPLILALFATGGVLTKAGQQFLDSLLTQQGTPPSNWPIIKLLLAIALLASLLALHHWGLPRFAHSYTNHGQILYERGDWSSAQNQLERALSLEPDLPRAQFYLGVIFEEYQQYQAAQTEYLKAVEGGYLPAYNNLARLYLRDQNYDEAVPLLLLALSNSALSNQAAELEYVLRKNLGQARLATNRLPEAETELLEAIRISETLEPPRPEAYCLMARVLEQQPSPPEPTALPMVQEAWTQCLQYANRPEYDAWVGTARAALARLENNSADPVAYP